MRWTSRHPHKVVHQYHHGTLRLLIKLASMILIGVALYFIIFYGIGR